MSNLVSRDGIIRGTAAFPASRELEFVRRFIAYKGKAHIPPLPFDRRFTFDENSFRRLPSSLDNIIDISNPAFTVQRIKK